MLAEWGIVVEYREWGLRPVVFQTMNSLTPAHARDLGYVQYHPGTEYTYFIQVRHVFATGVMTGDCGLCSFCYGDPKDVQQIEHSNIHHWFEYHRPHDGKNINCPLCKGKGVSCLVK